MRDQTKTNIAFPTFFENNNSWNILFTDVQRNRKCSIQLLKMFSEHCDPKVNDIRWVSTLNPLTDRLHVDHFEFKIPETNLVRPKFRFY